MDGTEFHRGRHAGILLPLFSCTSRRGWGIGEIPDLVPFCRWLDRAGCDFVQLLPVAEMAPGADSPYSAVTAMAIDPLYVGIDALEDFAAIGGEAALPSAQRAALEDLRAAPAIDYARVRALKSPVLRACYEHFVAHEARRGSVRAAELAAFEAEHAWWLADFALFRALREASELRAWWTWPEPIAKRDPAALEAARRELAKEIGRHVYLQWLADKQWREVRRAVRPVGLFGDVPFMVGGDSADVWEWQHAFRLDASVGTPPDAFSATGQNWGLPVYRWDVFERESDAWLRERARRTADLFDGVRVDHLVGFYRTYCIPNDPEDGEPAFVPPDEKSQRAQGERVMKVFLASGARIIAEDLGTVPDFVRASIAGLGLPGYRVLRWEREWKKTGQPFRDPLAWPAQSVAVSGTHDTETLVEWWESAPSEEREAFAAIPFLAKAPFDAAQRRFTPAIRDRVIELLFAAGSNLLSLPIQDVFGWRDRVNAPGTVGAHNWTWRLPWSVDEIDQTPEAIERAARLRGWAARHDRARP